jgi:phospholipid/cholesterol/gamma-HCH transport system substrate-binding protein
MKKQWIEIAVGFFVLICFACIGYMTVRLGKLQLFHTEEYTLKAKFRSVSGLKIDSQIEIAGIQIGRVSKLSLDPDDLMAEVEMKIDEDIRLGDDVIASIKTSGLIGDRYVQLSPGASEDYLEDGGFITETESPVDIEELVGKFVFGNVDDS